MSYFIVGLLLYLVAKYNPICHFIRVALQLVTQEVMPKLNG